MRTGNGIGSLSRWLVCAGAIALHMGISPVRAAEPDDLARTISHTLSGVQRRIASEPARAEKELLEARSLLAQLQAAAPGHAKLAALTAQAGELASKLETRLGHPVGVRFDTQDPAMPLAVAKPEGPSVLPGPVVSQLKRVDDSLTAVVAALEKGQLQSAGTRLAQAEKLMDELQSRHGSRIPAGSAEVTAARERMAGVSTQYANAKSAADAAGAAASDVQQQRDSQSREWMDKFAPFFAANGDQVLLIGAAFNSATASGQEKCRQAYAQANALMEVYRKTEFPHGKTQDLLYMEQRLAGTLADYNKGASRDLQEDACRPWVAKLRAFVDVGAGSPKYLVDSVTLSESDLQARSLLLAEAESLWSEYRKAGFPLGKSDELVALEQTMEQRLRDMPATLRQSRELLSADIEKVFDSTLARLSADTGWKTDPARMPDLVMERDVIALQEAIERYAVAVTPSDAKLETLKSKLAQIKDLDSRNRAVRAERTFMKADRFEGDDGDALRRKVESIVKEKAGATVILRVTLPAGNWQEENVQEWTDTTHTQWRHRVTRFMTAQAAAKGADGKVYLHSVHLASDRQSDDSWGALYGHVIGSDWMAEANVKKDSPSR